MFHQKKIALIIIIFGENLDKFLQFQHYEIVSVQMLYFFFHFYWIFFHFFELTI